jgi:hypothetical protein
MLFFTQKVLAARLETVYGTDSVPTAATHAFLAKNIRLFPMEGEDVPRELESHVARADQTLPVGLHARLEFEIEPTPTGTAGIAPPWGVLLRACGASETVVATTSVTYAPVWPVVDAVSIHMWIGGIRWRLIGARGDWRFELGAKTLPVLKFSFSGLFTQPADQAVPVANLTSQINRVPLPGSSANTPVFTINGVALAMRSFAFRLGNRIELRALVRREAIVATERAEAIETTVEATPLASFNPYQLAAGPTLVPLVLTHGAAAGQILTLNAPNCQMRRPAGLEESQRIMEWPLALTPLPQAGNDQWSLVLT